MNGTWITNAIGWTPQRHSLEAAAKMLAPGGIILSLLKPQYECDKRLLKRGVLPEEEIPNIIRAVRSMLPASLELVNEAVSPLKGSGGNREVWLMLSLIDSARKN